MECLADHGVGAQGQGVPAGRGFVVDPPDGKIPPLTPEAALNRLVEQLDEALVLLRAINAKLGRDR